MPTKQDLTKQAEALGIEVSTSDTKADIEAKLAEADPVTTRTKGV